MNMLTAAKAYAEQGVFILAVRPNKAPLPGFGLNTATNVALRGDIVQIYGSGPGEA